MAGYTRQSEAGIVDGGSISADDLNNEFDQIETAMGASGHSHTGAAGEGPKITSSGLANSAVITDRIADSAVTTAKINNNAVIEYEAGLENANFASGPGGSWQLKRWREIE